MPLKAGSIPRTVMLSSTFLELEEHREAVIDAILRADLYPEAMEHDSAKADKGLIDASLHKVENSGALP